jgi:hypothetical protein
VAKSERLGNDSLPTADEGAMPFIVRHDFGFQVTVPITWEVEYTPKVAMKGGQVVYITTRGNILFVSFGELNQVAKEFGTLDKHATVAITRLASQENITGKIATSSELVICGHRAILSNFQGSNRTGEPVDVWMVVLWCEVTNRYYSLHSELNQKEEFRYFPRVFASMAESLACHTPPADSPRPGWQWADVGFSPRSKLWFVQLFDYAGLIETYQSREITLKNGTGIQYEWPQRGMRPMWHVRERISPRDVNKIGYDEQGSLVVEHAIDTTTSEPVPSSFNSITYAYSLSTARGFVEFRDGNNVITKRIDGKWIAVENLTHRTVGTFPNIRLSAKKEDIESILVTNTCVVIKGRTTPSPIDDPSPSISR